MTLINEINEILKNDYLDESEVTKCELIENLIVQFGWEDVQEAMLSILLDDNRCEAEWDVAAQVFWGALLDNRAIKGNTVIALVYHRLASDENSDENNLAWSIASKFKKLNYLSTYDPMQDIEIIEEQKRLKIY